VLPAAFGNYDLLEELGHGGMGVVYKARQRRADRVVALKVIRSGPAIDAALRERFAAEARALARLQHPNIVQIFEVGEEAGCPFFSLEYVAGGTLARRLKDAGPLPSAEAAGLIEILAGAIDAAHRAGVLHRDLKPANVLLTSDGTPKVTDFGLAKRLDTEEGVTLTGAFLGTPSYMAPEQAAGYHEAVGPATDVYALGATLYELLTGRPPFRARTPLATARLVVEADPVPVRTHRHDVPADLEAICLKCLEKDPARRYARAGDLATDLEHWRRGEPTIVRPLSWLARQRRRLRRHRGKVLVIALVALVLLGVYLARVSRQQPGDAELRALERELDAGRPVPLIGATGLPRWYHWQLGHTRLVVSRTAPDGACSFQAERTSILELLRDPRHASFRLSAELRQDGTLMHVAADGKAYPQHGRVGLYACYQEYPAASGGLVDRVLLLGYSEQRLPGGQFPGQPHGPAWQVDDYLTSRIPADRFKIRQVTLATRPLMPKGPPGPWRRFEIEFTPGGARIRHRDPSGKTEEISLTAKTLADSEQALQKLVNDSWLQEGIQLVPLSPRAALGVWASRCSVSVRNVVLEPMSLSRADAKEQ
jgi:tRNA A-37 threonylcarbamoyl transferase component Bud32